MASQSYVVLWHSKFNLLRRSETRTHAEVLFNIKKSVRAAEIYNRRALKRPTRSKALPLHRQAARATAP